MVKEAEPQKCRWIEEATIVTTKVEKHEHRRQYLLKDIPGSQRI